MLGEFDTLRLTVRAAGNRKNCFLFSRYFSGNKKMVRGWYCAAVGKQLASRTIADIVSTIGIKGIEVPTEMPRFATAERERTAAATEDSGSTTPSQREETAHWNRIKNYTDPGYFQTYLSRYANGRFAALARSRLSALADEQAAESELTPKQKADIDLWNRIKNRTALHYFDTYLGRFPNGRFADLARSRLADLGSEQAVASSQGSDSDAAARAAWNRIKNSTHAVPLQRFLAAYPDSEFASFARSRLEASEGEQAEVSAADTTAPIIDVPAQVDTDQAVIDVAGRVADDSAVVVLTLNGRAIALGSGDRFRVQRAVPVGTSELRIAALDEWGNRAEKRIVIRRAAAEPEPEKAPAPAIEVDPMDEQYVAVRNANVRATPTTDAQRLTTLGAGTTVTVTGKVKGADWYRVEREAGGEGYVLLRY